MLRKQFDYYEKNKNKIGFFKSAFISSLQTKKNIHALHPQRERMGEFPIVFQKTKRQI